MASKLPDMAGLVLAVLVVAAPTIVRAADPAVCKQYARGALV
jgi:ABC-type sulfate transport system permease component